MAIPARSVWRIANGAVEDSTDSIDAGDSAVGGLVAKWPLGAARSLRSICGCSTSGAIDSAFGRSG